MQNLEDRLKELGDSISHQAPSELHPTARALRRIRVGRALRSGAVVATVAALAIGGFAAAGSLTSDEALPPAEKDDKDNPFVGSWITTDVDGNSRTLAIRASDEGDYYEITVHDDAALYCSGTPSTLTGTGAHIGSTLVVGFPEITCDDGSKPAAGGFSIEEIFRNLTFEYDPASDIVTYYSPHETRRTRPDGGDIYNGRTLVWGRTDAENRVGDVNGWITYGDQRGIWARDLSAGDPADRVLLSSTPGTPIGWSRDGSRLLVVRNDLFALNSDGTETRLTDVNGDMNGGSLSPDGTAFVYAATRECWWREACEAEGGNPSSAIYVVDTDGGSPRVLLASGTRRYPDPDKPGSYQQNSFGGELFETAVEEPRWSPDGSQIAYFDGYGDWGHSLRVMDGDGTDSHVVVENDETLGAGHVDGLEWSPDGNRLAFSVEGRLYVVGVDGSGFRLLTAGVEPYWSPDASHIAYTRADPETTEGGSLEIVRLEDLQVQNFGYGGSGPWTTELEW